MIADIAEEQLADDGTGEGDGGNIALGWRARIGFSVQQLEDRIDLADDTMNGRLVGWCASFTVDAGRKRTRSDSRRRINLQEISVFVRIHNEEDQIAYRLHKQSSASFVPSDLCEDCRLGLHHDHTHSWSRPQGTSPSGRGALRISYSR